MSNAYVGKHTYQDLIEAWKNEEAIKDVAKERQKSSFRRVEKPPEQAPPV